MRHELAKHPGEITLIAVGPLTNLGDLLTKYPETKKQIQRIVIMGGAIHAGYNNHRLRLRSGISSATPLRPAQSIPVVCL